MAGVSPFWTKRNPAPRVRLAAFGKAERSSLLLPSQISGLVMYGKFAIWSSVHYGKYTIIPTAVRACRPGSYAASRFESATPAFPATTCFSSSTSIGHFGQLCSQQTIRSQPFGSWR